MQWISLTLLKHFESPRIKTLQKCKVLPRFLHSIYLDLIRFPSHTHGRTKATFFFFFFPRESMLINTTDIQAIKISFCQPFAPFMLQESERVFQYAKMIKIFKFWWRKWESRFRICRVLSKNTSFQYLWDQAQCSTSWCELHVWNEMFSERIKVPLTYRFKQNQTVTRVKLCEMG